MNHLGFCFSSLTVSLLRTWNFVLNVTKWQVVKKSSSLRPSLCRFFLLVIIVSITLWCSFPLLKLTHFKYSFQRSRTVTSALEECASLISCAGSPRVPAILCVFVVLVTTGIAERASQVCIIRCMSVLSHVPAGSPLRGGNVAVYVFDREQPKLPTLFLSVLSISFCLYGHINCISLHNFSR